MAIDKSKIQKAAEKFIASGKIAQAIEEYSKILKENPKDWNLMIQIGDLLLKLNKTAEAIEHFQIVADYYYTDGFFLKAIAIYKRINKLDPSLTEICLKLSDLYLKQGLTMDAKSQLLVVAQHYQSKNQSKDAIQILKKLIEIEPDNLRTRNDLAKAYKTEGLISEAIQEYLEISEQLTRKNLGKENAAVLETAYKLDPKNVDILRKITTVYFELHEPVKANALLEESLNHEPLSVDVYSLAAEIYSEQKQFSKAHNVIDRAIQASAKKEELWEIKGDVYLTEGNFSRAFEQYLLIAEKEIQRKDLDRAVPVMQKITEKDPAFHPAWEKLTELYTLLRQNANLLGAYSSLADAYIGKTMYADAAACLGKLIKLDPEDSQHQEKLNFVNSFLEKTKPGTRKEYEVEAEVAQPPSSFTVHPSAETIPGVPAFQPQPANVPAQLISQPVVAKEPAPAPAVASHTGTISQEEKEYVSEHLIEAEVFNKYGLIDKAIDQLSGILAKFPSSVPARQKLKEIYLEKGERDRAVQECITMSQIFRKQGDNDQAEDLLSEARQINPNHAGLEQAFLELPAVVEPVAKVEVPVREGVPEKTIPPLKPATPVVTAPKAPPQISAKSVKTSSKIAIDTDIKKLLPRKGLKTSARESKENVLGEIEKLAQSIKTLSGSIRKPVIPKSAPAAQVSSNPPPAEKEAVSVPIPEEIEIEIEEPVDLRIAEKTSPAVTSEMGLPESAFEEVDFYAGQGLEREAREILEKLKKEHPDDSGVNRRLESLKAPSQPDFAARIGDVEIPIVVEPEMSEAPSLHLEAEPIPPSSPPTEEISIHLDEELIVQSADDQKPVVEQSSDVYLGDFQFDVKSQDLKSSTEMDISKSDLSAEEKFMEFGELDAGSLRESQDSNASKDAQEELSLEESLEQAVDAVFLAAPEESGESQKVEEEAEESTPAKKQQLFEEEDDFFDLAAELEEGLLNVQSAVEDERPPDGQNYSLEEILTDFKKGVDKQLGAEDYDTRYNLGIAYKEMGLVDEAIGEFQVAAKDPKRFLECCSMLGLCFVEKGMPKLAIKWYQKGLDTPGYGEEEYQGLRFELAQAHELMGESQKALEVYQEVYGVSANYRNVAKKVKDLQEQLKR